jgi:hypothetical protein
VDIRFSRGGGEVVVRCKATGVGLWTQDFSQRRDSHTSNVTRRVAAHEVRRYLVVGLDGAGMTSYAVRVGAEVRRRCYCSDVWI